MNADDPRLAAEAGTLGPPLVFVALTGDAPGGIAPEPDAADLRAVHVTPIRELVGLRAPLETIAHTAHREGLDIEIASQDVKRFCLALLKKNGQVLEHVVSPAVATSPAHEELREIAPRCASRHWASHYLSHARLLNNAERSLRNALRAARVLHTGRHLMRTGEVVLDLRELADHAVRDALDRLAEAPDAPADEQVWAPRLRDWSDALERARDESPLPAQPDASARRALDDWLVRTRFAHLK